MTALLITGSNGESISVTLEQVQTLSEGMHVDNLRTDSGYRQYLLRQDLPTVSDEASRSKTALFRVTVGSAEDTYLSSLPTA